MIEAAVNETVIIAEIKKWTKLFCVRMLQTDWTDKELTCRNKPAKITNRFIYSGILSTEHTHFRTNTKRKKNATPEWSYNPDRQGSPIHDNFRACSPWQSVKGERSDWQQRSSSHGHISRAWMGVELFWWLFLFTRWREPKVDGAGHQRRKRKEEKSPNGDQDVQLKMRYVYLFYFVYNNIEWKSTTLKGNNSVQPKGTTISPRTLFDTQGWLLLRANDELYNTNAVEFIWLKGKSCSFTLKAMTPVNMSQSSGCPSAFTISAKSVGTCFVSIGNECDWCDK